MKYFKLNFPEYEMNLRDLNAKNILKYNNIDEKKYCNTALFKSIVTTVALGNDNIQCNIEEYDIIRADAHRHIFSYSNVTRDDYIPCSSIHIWGENYIIAKIIVQGDDFLIKMTKNPEDGLKIYKGKGYDLFLKYYTKLLI